MFKNYLLVSLRNFRRNTLFSLINLVGLTLGICSSWLMLVYIYDEFSYDRHFAEHERIVRLQMQARFEDSQIDAAIIPVGVGPALKAQSPVVEKVAAFNKIRGQSLVFGKKRYPQEAIYLATEDLFNVLSIPLLEGDPDRVLAEPNAIVLSESTARLIFGNSDPINQVLEVPWGACKVTGIFADLPEQTHFHPKLFISIRTVEGYRDYEEMWNENVFYTYALLEEGASPEQLRSSLDKIVNDQLQPVFDEQDAQVRLDYQPLTEIHLESDLDFELEANSDIQYVYIFALLAAFMMLIACINYMNLSTAQAAERTKEVGVRKVLGALRTHLTRQFLAEAALLTFFAVLISSLAFALILPWFNVISGKHIGLADMLQAEVMAVLFLSMILVALLSGIYPAFFLSRINPLNAFGQRSILSSGLWLRKGLVIFQFAVAVITLVSTLVVYQQFSYMMNASLGFEEEQVIRIRLKRGESLQYADVIANEIRQLAEVAHVSMSNQSPGDEVKRDYFSFEVAGGESTQLTQWMTADHEVVNSLAITLLHGRNIANQEYESNEEEEAPQNDTEGREVLVNESLVRQMGWTVENAVGKTIKILPMDPNWEAKVVGVMKDFHFSSLHNKVHPLMMINFGFANEVMLVKVNGQQIGRTLDEITEIYQAQVGNNNMDYGFLDEHFAAQYQADSKRTQLFTIFSLLTTLIACLGLLGLASFSASRRTKEIGVRKVLGASVPRLLYLLSKDFLKLVLFSLVVAIPLANYFLTDWLESFAYRIGLGWWLFLIPAALVLLIAMLTVSGLTLRAARKNPVETLRYE